MSDNSLYQRAKYFIDKRIVLKDNVYPELNRVNIIVSSVLVNNNNEIILCTEIMINNHYVWVNLNEVAYIKQYAFSTTQYMEKNMGKNKNFVFNPQMEADIYKKVGSFDVYRKDFPPFNF